MAKRIQRRRTKGWKMPTGAINCTRPGRWGNPYTREDWGDDAIPMFRAAVCANKDPTNGLPTLELIRDELRGKDLACFCPLDQPCHVDVLLEFANR
jgi:hypothetical protein